MAESGMIVTGATGFVGRHVVETFARQRRIWALSRTSPTLRGVSLPAGVQWLQVDIADRDSVGEAVGSISREGSVDTLIHLAGHYDFTGEQHQDYVATNVRGTENVLEAARSLRVRDVVFASSVAACQFPAAGSVLDETSRPDGDTPYARSKRAGESLVAGYRGYFRAWNVRFAALFSDWCEYEPLFRFLESWLAGTAAGRIVAGQGLSAVPYMHVRDAVVFLQRLLACCEHVDCDRVLLAAPCEVTTHLELFEASTSAHFGRRSRPFFLPGPMCRWGLTIREVLGYAYGMHAFERPWMGRMIDKQLRVDSSATQAVLGWSPRPRLGVVRRMPFLIENRKSRAAEWLRRNHEALRVTRRVGHAAIGKSLAERHSGVVGALVDYVTDEARADRFPFLRHVRRERLEADAAAVIDRLLGAVRTGDKATFASICKDLARRRADEGIPPGEWASALDVLGDLCILSLSVPDANAAWQRDVHDHVTMTVQFGVDAVLDASEEEEHHVAS